MLRFGPKLEYRQAVLFRLVDAGAELFAMAASCARAQWLLHKDPAAGRRAVQVADLFCRQARARVRAKFRDCGGTTTDRKSTRLNSSHGYISYAVFCLKKKKSKIRPACICMLT